MRISLVVGCVVDPVPRLCGSDCYYGVFVFLGKDWAAGKKREGLSLEGLRLSHVPNNGCSEPHDD